MDSATKKGSRPPKSKPKKQTRNPTNPPQKGGKNQQPNKAKTKRQPPKPAPRNDIAARIRNQQLESVIEDMANANLRAATTSTTNQKEIVMFVEDYFDFQLDLTKPYWQWQFNTKQEIFLSQFAGEAPYTKLLEAWCYIAPRFAASDNQDQIITAITTVPALPGSQVSVGVSANPRTTTILPTPNSRWVLIGHYKTKKLFGDSSIIPFVRDNGAQVVFAGTLVNPDNFAPLTSLQKCQFRIKIKISAGLQPITNFEYAFVDSASSDTLSAGVTATITAARAALEIVGMTNVA